MKKLKIKILAAGASLLLSGFADPQSALTQDVVLFQDDAHMALFFDKEEMVETTTRSAKPLHQVAENVTIITSEEIERMNAHNVDEVLNRSSGLFLAFLGQDFNGNGAPQIHESTLEHVLILLDGIRWNDAYAGYPKTYNIPVEIISRIEIIKGPASSTWGSSLGGVVNIITKKTGTTKRPTGTVSASYGEADSTELNGTVAGKTGPASYFLAVSNQDSDGLMGSRSWQRDSIYGKVSLDLPKASTLTLTSGYNVPDFQSFDYNVWTLFSRAENSDRNFWFTASLDSALTEKVALNVNVFRKKETFDRSVDYLPPYTAYSYEISNELWTNGFSALLNSHLGSHKLVVGAEYDRSESDLSGTVNRDETWGLFANDTISVGNFSFTPGLRYDHFALTNDNQVSPSLGATWLFSQTTLFRAMVAKGFRRPYISDGAGNRDLEPEQITSFQLGMETSACSFARFKVSLFEHQLQDIWYYDNAWITQNGHDAKRYGYELEAATEPWNNLSARASFTYIYSVYEDDFRESDDQYSGKLTLLYDNPDIITAELFGIYTWWNDIMTTNGEYDTMVWDLSLNKKIQTSAETAVTLFATAHNLFDGRYYWYPAYENPHRWVEAGLRFHF